MFVGRDRTLRRTSWWERGTIALGALSLVAASVVATAPGALASDEVPQGIGQEIADTATVFGSTPGDTPVNVSIILSVTNQPMLQAYIEQASVTQRFLSVQQFAREFGQPEIVVHGIETYLASFGITSQATADNLDIEAQGTAGEFDQAFSVTLQDMEVGGHHFHGTRENPRVPSDIGSPILAVLGLTNYQGLFTSNAIKAVGLPSFTPQAGQPSGDETPAGLSAEYVAQHYDATPLYNSGDFGQNQTIGIITLASLNPSDAYAYWQQIGLDVNPNRISLANIDGGSGAPSLSAGSDETALDVEQSGALAPQANIMVYQAPNTDYGFADAYYQAVSDNTASTLSTSWGESEAAISYFVSQGDEAANYAQVFNQAYMEAAAQGQSAFAASGDSGAYAPARDLGTTQLGVINPSDSPYVTAAGGSTLAGAQNYGSFGTVTIPAERTWGWDYLWPILANLLQAPLSDVAEAFPVGSGGGYSTVFATPYYQLGPQFSHFSAVEYLTPINGNTAWTFNPTPSVTSGVGRGRAMPDLAMNADPQTGYGVYTTLFGGNGWAQYGGTSFVAPQLAGLGALINDANGGRVGFWNPQIYRFAQQHNSPFMPLDAQGTSSDNIYYTGTPNTIWNPGSGLGLPDIAALSRDFGASGLHGVGPGPGDGGQH